MSIKVIVAGFKGRMGSTAVEMVKGDDELTLAALLDPFATEKEAQNFFRYATSEIIRFAFLLTDESLTSLAKKVPDLLDYSDRNGVIDYSDNINTQLYTLFGIDDKNRQHIQKILASKKSD